MDIQEILKERRQHHGAFADHATVAQLLKDVMHNSRNWDKLTAVQKEGLEMVQHKIARILSGDPNIVDHWVDCQGYLKLVQDDIIQKTPVKREV